MWRRAMGSEVGDQRGSGDATRRPGGAQWMYGTNRDTQSACSEYKQFVGCYESRSKLHGATTTDAAF